MFNNNLNNHHTKDNLSSSNSLDKDPRLDNIDPVKLKIIKEIASKSKGKSMEEMLPQIMKINQELQTRNISFSKDETALLMTVIEETLSPKDKMKFNMLKGFIS